MKPPLRSGFVGCSPATLKKRSPINHYHALTDALAARGWTGDACASFAGKNWMRVFERALAGR